MMKKMSVMLLWFVGACCSSGSKEQPASAASKAPIENIRGSLVEFRDQVNRLTDSFQDRSSVNDPNSLRGRIKAEEERLSLRAKEIRSQLGEDVAGDRAQINDEAKSREALLKELDEAEAELQKIREQLEQTDVQKS